MGRFSWAATSGAAGLGTGAGRATARPVEFLQLLRDSSLYQQEVDLTHGVHWSRHLLANIQKTTGAELLIGASAATYNTHFRRDGFVLRHQVAARIQLLHPSPRVRRRGEPQPSHQVLGHAQEP